MTKKRPVRRTMLWVLAAFFLPLVLSASMHFTNRAHGLEWWQARDDLTGMAPAPDTTPQAVVQVYAARAFSWRGIFGVHTWIAAKPSGADYYTRYEVFGWGVRHGREALRVRRSLHPDGYWVGNRPWLLVDRRGPGVDAMIEAIDAAARRYPHNHQYRLWPGPNSNTFTAYIGREVPALGLELPPTAIGKDYIAGPQLLARSPSGTGAQLSLFGLAGVMVGLEEGLEFNLLGLSVGLDPLGPALNLPGVGRIGWR
ncbi:MAG: DUF3750 domain-containing protein [Candidatus Competibacterales bacterium]|nr:DUF3750 domain-containing protein [Candidatus Competibacterales bacterium]